MTKPLNTREAAEYLGFSEGGLRRMAARGDVPCKRIGGGNNPRYRFVQEVLDRWLMQQPAGIDPREVRYG